MKNREGKLGGGSVTLLYTSPDSCSNSVLCLGEEGAWMGHPSLPSLAASAKAGGS